MFLLEWIYKVLKGFLGSLGLSVVGLFIICFYTNMPAELFKMIEVEPNIVKSDVIMVLGAGVTMGGQPGKTSTSRAVEGIVLYKKGYASKILFTGGWDHEGYIASAKAMAALAKDLGVRPEDILVEDKSMNTYENILFSKEIMQQQNMQTALIVTSDSHMRRSMAISQKLQVPARPAPVQEALVKPELNWKAKMHNFSILYQVLYESVAILKYKQKGWL
jgi:uncharacterized SAM-binding protein YcdF (DUF218 family)